MKPSLLNTINIGTDIVHIPRITNLLHRRRNSLVRFTNRILSDSERADFESILASKNVNANKMFSPDVSRWIAGRFAAKEAARKASPLGAASVGWRDVVVHVPRLHHVEGSVRPEIVYLHATTVGKLSISHDGEYVVATVLAAT